MRDEILRHKFPGLRSAEFRITSLPTHIYNCFAWAVGDDTNWWSPQPYPKGKFVWPAGVVKDDTLEGWTAALEAVGFVPCDDGGLEPGWEKVALFATSNGAPQHVARQLLSGRWTSKLGTIEDIEHDLHGLAGDRYGEVVAFMRRPSPSGG